MTASALGQLIFDNRLKWPIDLRHKAERAHIILIQRERGTYKKAGKIMREENNKDLRAFADAMEAHMKGKSQP